MNGEDVQDAAQEDVIKLIKYAIAFVEFCGRIVWESQCLKSGRSVSDAGHSNARDNVSLEFLKILGTKGDKNKLLLPVQFFCGEMLRCFCT